MSIRTTAGPSGSDVPKVGGWETVGVDDEDEWNRGVTPDGFV
jgi:hypothetical protein